MKPIRTHESALKVLDFHSGNALPECAGDYLVIDARMQYHVCEAEHRDDGTFACFRVKGPLQFTVAGTEVMAWAQLGPSSSLVQDLYSQVPADAAMLVKGCRAGLTSAVRTNPHAPHSLDFAGNVVRLGQVNQAEQTNGC